MSQKIGSYHNILQVRERLRSDEGYIAPPIVARLGPFVERGVDILNENKAPFRDV